MRKTQKVKVFAEIMVILFVSLLPCYIIGSAAVVNNTKIKSINEQYAFMETNYNSVGNFSNGLAWVSVKNKDGSLKFGYIDKKGNLKIPAVYLEPSDFSEGLAAVSQERAGHKFPGTGVIDTNGKWVVSLQFIFHTGSGVFKEGIIAGGNSDAIGKSYTAYMDKKGKIIGKNFDPYVQNDFSEGMAGVAVIGSGCGFINKTGGWVIPPSKLPNARSVSSFSEGLAAFESTGGTGSGYIDKTGKEVIPDVFKRAYDFHEGLAAVSQYPKDKDGQFDYDEVSLYGFINKTGKFVVPPKYRYAGDFSEGLAVVLDNKHGYVDKTGKVVIQEQFYDANNFHEGVAIVSVNKTPTEDKNKRFGFIDKTGKWLIQPIFDKVNEQFGLEFHEGMARVVLNNKWGYVFKKAVK